jgi:uncharacterized membrane protein
VYEEGSSTHGEYQSELSYRCRPPWLDTEINRAYLWAIGIVSAIAAVKVSRFAGTWWWGVGTFALLFLVFITIWKMTVEKRRLRQYHSRREAWEKSWVCMKCGEAFFIEQPHSHCL